MRSVTSLIVCVTVALISLLSSVCAQAIDQSVQPAHHYSGHRSYSNTGGGNGSTGLWIGLGLGIGLPVLGILIFGLILWKKGAIRLDPTGKDLFQVHKPAGTAEQSNGAIESSARTQNMPASQETSVV